LKKTQPDEVYNVAGQTSVGLSFEQPVETLRMYCGGDAEYFGERFGLVGSRLSFIMRLPSEVFGDTQGAAADESTPFSTRSPYAVAKATAFWEVANYREAYGLFACSGILFDRDSPLRPERFVTQKRPVRCGLRRGSRISCIWGISIFSGIGDGLRTMWRRCILCCNRMSLMTMRSRRGRVISMALFIEIAFRLVGLDWREYVGQ
jgi:GDPmannose 4,6-dehydratase